MEKRDRMVDRDWEIKGGVRKSREREREKERERERKKKGEMEMIWDKIDDFCGYKLSSIFFYTP